MTPMSSLSRHSKERRAADNNSTSLPTHGVRKFRKGSSILTVIKFIAKDGTSLAAAILSAIILQGYNPHRKHISRISKILGNQRLKHLKTQQSSGHFVHLESASQWIKQARTQLMEKIGRHETLDITPRFSHLLESLQIPPLLTDPPPILFFLACLLFAFAIAAFRHSRRADYYQDRILATGIGVGLIAASQTENFLMESKAYIAWSTILALVCSGIAHGLLNLLPERNLHVDEKTRTAAQID